MTILRDCSEDEIEIDDSIPANPPRRSKALTAWFEARKAEAETTNQSWLLDPKAIERAHKDTNA